MHAAQSSEQHPRASAVGARCQDGRCSLHLWRATSQQCSSGWGCQPFQSWSQQCSLCTYMGSRLKRQRAYPDVILQSATGISSGPRKTFSPFSGVGLNAPYVLRVVFMGTYQTGRCPLSEVALRGNCWPSALLGGRLCIFPPVGPQPDSQMFNFRRTWLCF